ncbi:hypothetical protein CSC12_5794 [Klebsiella michiganensis]|nr:hypothetical protein CSC12_5794 [Klebsiella michiganensis]
MGRFLDPLVLIDIHKKPPKDDERRNLSLINKPINDRFICIKDSVRR